MAVMPVSLRILPRPTQMVFIVTAAERTVVIVFTGIIQLPEILRFIAWDLLLSFLNRVLPALRPTIVIPTGSPGAGGQWPEYIPPSRRG